MPIGLGSWFRSMSCENVTELTWWQSKVLEGDGVTKRKLEVVCTPAQHWSLRNGCDRNQVRLCRQSLIHRARDATLFAHAK